MSEHGAENIIPMHTPRRHYAKRIAHKGDILTHIGTRVALGLGASLLSLWALHIPSPHAAEARILQQTDVDLKQQLSPNERGIFDALQLDGGKSNVAFERVAAVGEGANFTKVQTAITEYDQNQHRLDKLSEWSGDEFRLGTVLMLAGLGGSAVEIATEHHRRSSPASRPNTPPQAS